MPVADVSTVADQQPGTAAEHRRPGRPRSERADARSSTRRSACSPSTAWRGCASRRWRPGAGVGKGQHLPPVAGQGGPAARRAGRAQDTVSRAAWRVGSRRPGGDAERDGGRLRRPAPARSFALLLGEGAKFPPADVALPGHRGQAAPRGDQDGAAPWRGQTASCAQEPTSRWRCSCCPVRCWPAASTSRKAWPKASPSGWWTNCWPG